MLFNSISFAIFLPIVFLIYWSVSKKSLALQNFLLLGASWYFYASWDYRFLFLLMFSIALDYFAGLKIHQAATNNSRKLWLWISIASNLGFLGFFKYFNFFVASFTDFLSAFGLHTSTFTLKIILPVGISFYTFHGLSYIIDIYKKRIPPEKNFVNYAVFVSFFPLLVAGPIERATHLLPQIQQKRHFDYSVGMDGLRRILWGLFKKIVIADNCAYYADMIFNHSGDYSGSTLFLGAIFFTFQIYCDFSGYSDIALGTARLFGIELLQNFSFPYFSRDIAEFWRRWHISLSSWFRDYLYIPLGGGHGGMLKKVRNVFIIFLVSGLWHGANWTFVAWGALNAIYILPHILFTKKNLNTTDIVAQGKYLPTVKEFFQMLLTFILTVFAWIFFRANNLEHAFSYIAEICRSFFTNPGVGKKEWLLFFGIGVLMLIEWLGREQPYAIAHVYKSVPRPVRWGIYYAMILVIFYFAGRDQEFIYFQF